MKSSSSLSTIIVIIVILVFNIQKYLHCILWDHLT